MVATSEHVSRSVLGAAASSGFSGGVAVAIGALVVVVAIVLVFVMLFRSGGSKRTASGLGYDAQQGPLGQPQSDPAAGSPWPRPAQQQGWPQHDDFGTNGSGQGQPSTPFARGSGAGWGQTQDYNSAMGAGAPVSQGQARWGAQGQGQGQHGGWGEPTPQGGALPWEKSGAATDNQWPDPNSGWNPPQVPASRPINRANAGQGGGWDVPSQGGWDAPAQGAPESGRGGWGDAPASQPAPWDQAGANAPAWGDAPASQPGSREWGAPAAAAGAGAAAGWGMEPPASGGMGGWNGDAGSPRDWNAGPGQQPFGEAIYGAEADKTRVVRPSGAGPRQGMIVVRQGKEPGRIFEVRKDKLTIGRSRESDIFLEDLAVSRLHTTIFRDEGGRYLLHDENSANGTYVNGQRVSDHVLEEGDEIQVGQTVLAFVRR